jgi:hypothetical protein
VHEKLRAGPGGPRYSARYTIGRCEAQADAQAAGPHSFGRQEREFEQWVTATDKASRSKQPEPEQKPKADQISPRPEHDASVQKLLESLPNTKFRPGELENIPVLIQEVLEGIKNLEEMQSLTDDQLQEVKKTLDKQGKDAGRLGKKDWTLVAIGAVTTLAISVALPAPTVLAFTKLFIHEAAHLFGEGLAG